MDPVVIKSRSTVGALKPGNMFKSGGDIFIVVDRPEWFKFKYNDDVLVVNYRTGEMQAHLKQSVCIVLEHPY